MAVVISGIGGMVVFFVKPRCPKLGDPIIWRNMNPMHRKDGMCIFVVIFFHRDGAEIRLESSYVWMQSDVLFGRGYNCEMLVEPKEGM